jgi:CysZ protein
VRRQPGKVGVVGGLNAFGGGIGFVVTTPSVWPYAAVPALMLVLLFTALACGGGYAAYHGFAVAFGEELGAWGRTGRWLAIALTWVVTLLLAALLALALAQPLSGFALEKIVYAQERALTGRVSPPPGFFLSMVRSTKVALVTVFVGVTVIVPLFLVALAFPPAAVVTVPLKFVVAAWLLAWDFIDYPLGVREWGLRARFRWVARNFPAFTVFGLLWASLVVVPGVVLLLLPMGVAGATRLVVAADEGEAA